MRKFLSKKGDIPETFAILVVKGKGGG